MCQHGLARIWQLGLVAVVMAAMRCEKSPDTSVPVSPVAVSSVASETTKPAPPDDSQDVSELIKLGMPAPDRDWVSFDMQRAAAVASKLGASSPGHLPRFQSPKSGEMFARMASAKGLQFYQNETLPIASRLSDMAEYMGEASTITKIYMAAFLAGKVGGRELIEFIGGMLQIVAIESELMDGFVRTIPIDDPNYANRLKGMQMVRQGLAEVVAGSLTALTENANFSASERVILLGYQKLYFPIILPRLTDASRMEALTRVKEMCEDDALKELRPAICELRELLVPLSK